MLRHCLLSLFLAGLSFAQPVITTFAGGGPKNLQATASGIGFVTGVAADTAGNFYFNAIPQHRIYKVDTSGQITTLAGVGFARYDGLGAFSGDNGQAVNAFLNTPFSVALDGIGNLYFSDAGNHRIRKISLASGIITTVAGNGTQGFSGDGGPATAASMDTPTYVQADGAGNVFFVDSKNYRVRWIAPNGFINTMAGLGTQATFGDGGLAVFAGMTPTGIALDGLGNLYIGDGYTDVIRKVELSTNFITTVAGNGNKGFSGDNGPALQASFDTTTGLAAVGGNLYISDGNNHRVRLLSGGNITTVAGNGTQAYSGDGQAATSAGVYGPTGIALDGQGRLYIAAAGEQRIRRVASGIINTVAGNGAVGYAGDGFAALNSATALPTALVLDGGNYLYFSDADKTVRRISLSTGTLSLIAGTPGVAGFSGDNGLAVNAKLGNPVGLALDNAGSLYISDGTNHRIRRVALGTGIITTFAGTGVQGNSGDNGQASNANLNSPSGIVIDGSGNLFFSQGPNSVVRKIVLATGVITRYAGSGFQGNSGDNGQATSAGLATPGPLSLDAAGNLFIADVGNGNIRRVDAVTKVITRVAGPGGFIKAPPAAISTQAYGGDGGLATSAGFSDIFGVASDSAGNLYVNDARVNRIRRIDAVSKIITTVAGNGTEGFSGDGGPATSASMSLPLGMAVDSAGNYYFADALNFRIRRVGTAQACSYALAPTSASAPAAGGVASVTVTTTSNCAWTAVSNSGILNIVSGSSATGSGTVSYNVSANSGAQRSGTMTIAGQTFTVTQDAASACTYSLNPTSASAAAGGGTGSFGVTAGNGCGWTAVSNAAWITVTSGASGSGTGTVGYSAQANSGAQRAGTITAGGQTFTVTQAAGSNCTYSILPVAATASAAGGGNAVSVTAGGGCGWTAVSNVAWIIVTGGASGTGNGSVNYSVTGNSGSQRVGTVTIAGQTFTVTQAAANGCTYSLASQSATATSAGGGGNITVTASAGCSWTAVSNDAWLVITGGSSGSGNGIATYFATGNSGVQRTGTVTIAGFTFTVSQAGNPNSSTAFVQRMFLDFLGRPADASGLAFWVNLLDSNQLTRAQVALSFFNSPEFNDTGLYITNAYTAILARDPDYGGWKFWFDQVRNGAPRVGVVNSFIVSPEFVQVYGALTNTQFVNLVYQNVFGRQADAGGLNFWVGQLQTGATRAQMMESFMVSPEYRITARTRQLSNLCYLGFLGRTPEAAGRAFWTSQLDGGLSDASLVNLFITSAEFLARL